MCTNTPISQPIINMEVGFEKKSLFLTRPSVVLKCVVLFIKKDFENVFDHFDSWIETLKVLLSKLYSALCLIAQKSENWKFSSH